MAGKTDWLDAGFAILVEHGAPGLTIERLMGRMGLTKGSFYHHFAGMPGFKTAFLEYFEAAHTAAFIGEVEAAGATPRARLDHLLELILTDDRPDPEVAMRAWAMQDPEVRDVLERIDQTRIDYLRSVWLEASDDPGRSSVMGQLLYLIFVGAGHVIPPITGDGLRAVYDIVLGAPEERGKKKK